MKNFLVKEASILSILSTVSILYNIICVSCTKDSAVIQNPQFETNTELNKAEDLSGILKINTDLLNQQRKVLKEPVIICKSDNTLVYNVFSYHELFGLLPNVDPNNFKDLEFTDFVNSYYQNIETELASLYKEYYENAYCFVDPINEVKKAVIAYCDQEYLISEVIPLYSHVLSKYLKANRRLGNDACANPIEECRNILLNFYYNKTFEIENAGDLIYFLNNQDQYKEFNKLVLSGKIEKAENFVSMHKFNYINQIEVKTNDEKSIILLSSLIAFPENVKSLVLERSGVSNILDFFQKFSGIEKLNLRRTSINEECLKRNLKNFKKVREVDATYTNIVHYGLFDDLKNLEKLSIVGCSCFGKHHSCSICNVFSDEKKFKKLRRLNIIEKNTNERDAKMFCISYCLVAQKQVKEIEFMPIRVTDL